MRGEFVGRGEEHLRPKTLEQCAPGFLAMDGGSERADALRGDDRNEPRLPAQRERALVAGWVGVAGRGEAVILVANEQQIPPRFLRRRRDPWNAPEDGALEVQFQ